MNGNNSPRWVLGHHLQPQMLDPEWNRQLQLQARGGPPAAYHSMPPQGYQSSLHEVVHQVYSMPVPGSVLHETSAANSSLVPFGIASQFGRTMEGINSTSVPKLMQMLDGKSAHVESEISKLCAASLSKVGENLEEKKQNILQVTSQCESAIEDVSKTSIQKVMQTFDDKSALVQSETRKLCAASLSEVEENLKEKKQNILQVTSQCESAIEDVSKTSIQKVMQTLDDKSALVQSEISKLCAASLSEVEENLKERNRNILEVTSQCESTIKDVSSTSILKLTQTLDDKTADVQSEIKKFCSASVSQLKETVRRILEEAESDLMKVKSTTSATSTTSAAYASQAGGSERPDLWKQDKDDYFTESTSLKDQIVIHDSASDSELDQNGTSDSMFLDKDTASDSRQKKNKRMSLSEVKNILNDKCSRESTRYETRRQKNNGGTEAPLKKRALIIDSDDEEGGSSKVDDGLGELSSLSRNQLSKIKKDDIIDLIMNNESKHKNIPPEPECGVCLGKFLDKKTLDCGHSFCQICLEEWHKIRVTCPLCRNEPDIVMY